MVEQPAPEAAVALGSGAVVFGVQGRDALGERLAHVDRGRCCCCFFQGAIARSGSFRCRRGVRCGRLQKRRRGGLCCSPRCWRRGRRGSSSVSDALSWRRSHAAGRRRQKGPFFSPFCFFSLSLAELEKKSALSLSVSPISLHCFFRCSILLFLFENGGARRLLLQAAAASRGASACSNPSHGMGICRRRHRWRRLGQRRRRQGPQCGSRERTRRGRRFDGGGDECSECSAALLLFFLIAPAVLRRSSLSDRLPRGRADPSARCRPG